MINISFPNFPTSLSFLALAEFLIPPIILFPPGKTNNQSILFMAAGTALLLLLIILITTVIAIPYKRWVLQLLLGLVFPE